MTGIAPMLLLDEVVAHLDPRRRAGALRGARRLGAQVWMTGADPAAFAEIWPAARMFTASDAGMSTAHDCAFFSNAGQIPSKT